MAFDLKGFFKDLNLSDEEAAAVTAVLDKPERVTVLEKSVLRQQDYSKHMDALRKAQDDLKTANDRLNAEMAEWAETQALGGEITEKMRRDLESANAKVATLTTRVTNLATQAGMDPTKALEGIDQPPPKKDDDKPAPAVDLSGYAKADQISALANMALTLPSTLLKLSHEHQQLTGEFLDTDAIVREITTRANTRGNQKSLDPRVVWEELHDVPTKREAIAKKKHDDEIAAAEQRGRERALSEQALPVPPSHGQRSPLLRTLDGDKPREPVMKRSQPESAVQGAAAALRSGKYRQQNNARGAA